MALYAIGDLHLSFSSNKPMDVFGGGWENYIEKIELGFSQLSPDDTCVLCGDSSWAMSLDESLADFRFIEALPGKKVILKGNHDYWWTTVTKMKSFFVDNSITGIDFLHNNCYFYEDTAICGTRGWISESELDLAHNAKVMHREASRLRASLSAAGGAADILCFFHYPPRYKNAVCEEMIDVLNEFSIKKCWYGHIHSQGRRFAVQGIVDGVSYNLISADFVDFVPQRIL